MLRHPNQIHQISEKPDFENSEESIFYFIKRCVKGMIKGKELQARADLSLFKDPEARAYATKLLTDGCFRSLLLGHAHWVLRSKQVIELGAEGLEEFLSSDPGQLTTDSLPRNVYGFVSLPRPVPDQSGDEFQGFYYFIGPGRNYLGGNRIDWHKYMEGSPGSHIKVHGSSHVISLAWLDADCNANHLTRTFNGGEPIELLVKDVAYTETYLPSGITGTMHRTDGLWPHERMMIQTVINFHSGAPKS